MDRVLWCHKSLVRCHIQCIMCHKYSKCHVINTVCVISSHTHMHHKQQFPSQTELQSIVYVFVFKAWVSRLASFYIFLAQHTSWLPPHLLQSSEIRRGRYTARGRQYGTSLQAPFSSPGLQPDSLVDLRPPSHFLPPYFIHASIVLSAWLLVVSSALGPFANDEPRSQGVRPFSGRKLDLHSW